jgi:hypothetical protein
MTLNSLEEFQCLTYFKRYEPLRAQQRAQLLSVVLPLAEHHSDEIYSIPVISPSLLIENPDYSLKGAHARNALLESLRVKPYWPIRDLDFVRITSGSSKSSDEDLARRFNQSDYIRGHGVELCFSVERYMGGRDFTFNQVLLSRGRLFFTIDALFDSALSLLRFVHPRKVSFSRENARMLRFIAIKIFSGLSPKISGFEQGSVSHFDLALELAKAYQVSENLAETFCDILCHLGYCPFFREQNCRDLVLQRIKEETGGILPEGLLRDRDSE